MICKAKKLSYKITKAENLTPKGGNRKLVQCITERVMEFVNFNFSKSVHGRI